MRPRARGTHVPIGALLTAMLIALPFLASASPPDLTWAPGFYDAADHDDAVALVLSETARIEPMTSAEGRSVLPRIGSVARSPIHPIVAPASSDGSPRGPPLAAPSTRSR